MSELYTPGSAIEGEKVVGSSRDPLIARGRTKLSGKQCFRFCAKFNVKARVTEGCADANCLDKTAIQTIDASILCDKAIIHSLDGRPATALIHGSSTHKATQWNFGRRTSVAIEQAHQELINGMRKRGEALMQLGPEGSE